MTDIIEMGRKATQEIYDTWPLWKITDKETKLDVLKYRFDKHKDHIRKEYMYLLASNDDALFKIYACLFIEKAYKVTDIFKRPESIA